MNRDLPAEIPFSDGGGSPDGVVFQPVRVGQDRSAVLAGMVLPREKRLWYIAARESARCPPFSLIAKAFRRIDP